MRYLILVATLVPVLSADAVLSNDSPVQSRQIQSAELGKLTGMVTDPHDARINGAKILIVRKDFKREVVTDEEGFFQIDLSEGTYLISASAYGFAQVNRRRIYIKANAVMAINLKLWPKAFID